jgi:hypothetical protein
MSEREEDITNKLRAQSQEFQLPVEEFVWDAIEAGIAEPPQRKKRGFIWLFILAGLLTTSLVLAFFIQGAGEKNQFARLNQSTLGLVNKSNPTTSNVTIDTVNTAESDNDETSIVAVSNAQLAQNRGNQTKNSENQKIKSDGITKNNSSKSNEAHKIETLAGNELAVVSKENNTNPTLKDNDPGVDSAPEITPVVPDDLAEEISDSTKNDENTTSIHQPDSTQIIAKISKDKLPFRLMAYGGLGESFRTLKSDSHSLLVDHKNAHETYSACYELGLLADFGLSQTLYIRSGVSYKFYSEKYDFQHDLITHRTKNDYQYFQVPLRLGWNVLQTKRSTLGLIGGIQANVLFSAQSSWVDPTSLTPIAHNTLGTSSPFRSMTGAVNFGIDYSFLFAKKWRFHVIPSVDRFAFSVYKRNTDLDQKPYSFNVDVGFSFSF